MQHSPLRKRRLATLVAVLACATPAGVGVGVAVAQDPQPPTPREQDNFAISQVTTDGARDWEFAWDLWREDVDDTVDNGNLAWASTKCANCRSVAIAFQIVLAVGKPSKFVPENVAVAFNDHSDSSVAYADARQFVRVYTKPVRIRAAGREVLADVRRDIRALEDDGLDPVALDLALDKQRTRVLEVIDTQVVQIGGGEAREVNRRSHSKHDDA
jgi:putative peptide zinc metalloprotease protein